MTNVEHLLNPEELMAYVDGELPPDRAVVVQAHVAGCVSCQRLSEELRGISRDVARWDVGPAPASMRAPRSSAVVPRGRRFVLSWRPMVVLPVASAAALVLLTVAVSFQGRRPALDLVADRTAPIAEGSGEAMGYARKSGRADFLQPGSADARGSGGGLNALSETPPRAPMIARTVSLKIVAKDFDAVRPAVDRILRDLSGYVGQITATSARGSSRSLIATLRVPAGRLPDALAALKALGQVIEESQGGDDVTEQAVDLDARLTNARNTERRLTDVLQHRTGDVGDVLAVEREIARVRGEIERLDAERKNLERRVAYATVTLEIAEERKADLDLGPLPVTTLLRNATIDGFRGAFAGALDVALYAARVAPALLLWSLILAWPAWRLRRLLAVRHHTTAARPAN